MFRPARREDPKAVRKGRDDLVGVWIGKDYL